jgi:hypothetical protein
MRGIELHVLLGSVLAASCMTAGCDQGTKQSNQPTGAGQATSSDRKETHPEQPTGKPQSGEIPQPVQGR